MASFKKYYKLIIILIILTLIPVFMFRAGSIETDGYSTDNVLKTIAELSSNKYMGRRYGTKENMEAVKYIEEQFKNIGLKPAGENGTYLKNYNEITRTYNGAAVMELLDQNGKLIKSYKYGDDFIEQSYSYSGPGELTSGWSYLTYNNGEVYESANSSKLIAVVSGTKRTTRDLQKLYLSLGGAGYKGVITTVPDSSNLIKESASVMGRGLSKSGYEIPSLIVKESIGTELYNLSSKGYKINIKSTFDVTSAPVADVLGMIPGKGKGYLLVTAHLDHIGPASDGKVYPGALDNASGVATMLEIARYIKSQGKTPKDSIVFVAFNGEEGGLLGSTNYARRPLYPLYQTTVLNLDMVGAKSDLPLSMMFVTPYNNLAEKVIDPSLKMRHQLKNLADGLNITTSEINSGASDHAYFNYLGVPALTLIDFDTVNTHTPIDNMDNIGRPNIERALKISTGFIALKAFSNTSVAGYSIKGEALMKFLKTQFPLLILLILVNLLHLYLNKKNPKANYYKKFPTFTALNLLLITLFISYLPMEYISGTVEIINPFKLLLGSLLSLLKSILMMPLYVMTIIPGLIIIFLFKSKINSWKYEGKGEELKIGFYLSILSVALASIYLAVYFNKPTYAAVTPDFARDLSGKIIMHLILALVSLIIYKYYSREMDIKLKGYSNFMVFALAFFILISTFYMPIVMNKYVINSNSSGVNISVDGPSIGGPGQ